jgi:FtsH-binding integral membrane protein
VTFQGNQGSGGYGQPGDQTLRVNGVDVRAGAQVQGAFLTQAFFWMFAGLLLTAAIAAFVQFNPALQAFAADFWIVLIFGQLGLAIGIQALIGRISATIALGLFFVFAASLGLSIGLIVGAYTGPSVAIAFLSASAMFGGAALYGYTTKRSLASIGAFASMAVLGLFVAMIVNLFLGSDVIGYIVSVVGVILFTVLTAWDVQRINSGQLVQQLGSVEKAAVIGALHLYLDFVNLFLFLLRLFGDRR